MKIIFLDIDGVVNTLRQSEQNYINEAWSEDEFAFDETAMNNLIQIIQATDAYIVISSTWRMGRPDTSSWRVLSRNMTQYGLMDRIIDATPIMNGCYRSEEIAMWLEETIEEVDRFVILDDIEDMQELQEKLVCTDMFEGIREQDIARAIQLLM